ncbi:sensor histidine kinase [Luteimonas suaedae]|uniref:sensor histidine kinase n=1 Tax=Luteimonas suaedae TaxID=2605430 RepID=UPI0011EFCC80|nr:HAMP domain-containing sensor histidine kinase [Luteimonas suaedae]
MSGRQSLRAVLARQWIVFGLVLFAGFTAMTVLLLFILEDSFIDRRLRDVAARIVDPSAPTVLPEGFAVYPADAAPEALLVRSRGMRTRGVREFRLPDGRYVHMLSARTAEGAAFLLVHDVSDQLAVNAALARAWPWLLPMAALLALGAYALARAFMGRVSRQTASLVARVGEGDDPSALHAYAREAPVREFGQLAQHLADAWEARLAALQRERETLSFLSHELRTPLQSVRNSLELLRRQRDDTVAWQRLERAVSRLTRASASILWLAGDAARAPEAGPTALRPLLAGLIDEFAPLAIARGQVLHLAAGADCTWPLPEDVAETVLSNLLLNAIQHGGPGDVRIDLGDSGLRLTNPVSPHLGDDGYGLGLQLVRRILARIGRVPLLERDGDAVLLTVTAGDVPPQAG